MKVSGFGWFVASVFTLGLLASGVRADAESEYNRAIEQAVQSFRARDFLRARELFEIAHDSNPSARTWRGLGLTDFEMGHYALAIRELEDALVDPRRPLDPQQRTEVQAIIEHAQGLVGKLEIKLSPVDATLTVDEVPVVAGALTLDAGSHLLRARAAGYVDGEWRLDVQAGEVTSAALALEREPPTVAAPAPALQAEAEPYDPTQREAAWVVGGVGVAGVIVGSVFGVRSLVKHKESDEYCSTDGSCSDPRGVEAMDAARTAGDISTVAFVVGGVALGAATVLFLTAPEEHATSAQPLSLRLGPGSAVLRGAF